MKSFFIIILLLFICLFSSCKEEKKAEGYDVITNTSTEASPVESGVFEDNQNPMDLETENKGKTMTEMQGRYVKIGEKTGSDCNCYCIDINFTSSSRLCLEPDKLYINARFEKIGDRGINVFLEGPAGNDPAGKNIPWAEFDKNEPIAILNPDQYGNLELNWLGFSTEDDIDSDLATNSKKILEGTYKKI